MINLNYKILLILGLLLSFRILNAQNKLAQTPPMGWNSYDCYGASVTEQEVKANADMMAVHLKDYGWEYIVIDYCWFYPYSGAMSDPPQDKDFKPALAMDQYGRLLPAIDKFPSAAGGEGFKPLADYVHSKGLKFGIHVMRGIPRQAVAENTLVSGTSYHAKDVYNPKSTCGWLNSMYGIDCSRNGAREYYNSIINLYAGWGVDYIKVDDISKPYSSLEIEAIHNAISRCGRDIILSLSPGATPIQQAGHVAENANLWRISDDYWDDWKALKQQFELCNSWSKFTGSGHWADADMLPLGRLNRRGPHQGVERMTNFTREEQKTMMTLWCIFRSPLMIGADLMVLDNLTKSLLSNREVLEVNQNSLNNHQLSKVDDNIIWIADIPGTQNKYLALFNLGEKTTAIEVKLKDLGFVSECQIRNLWTGSDTGTSKESFSFPVPAHGSELFRVSIK